MTQPLHPIAPLPLVSVIIPSYNHARYVGQALASVVAQTYPNWELVVVDDGSTDGSVDVIRAVVAGLADDVRARVRVVVKTNGGVASALNRGLESAAGAFVCTLASDDWYAPSKLARQIAQFEAGPPDLGLVHSNCYGVDADGCVLGKAGPVTPSVGHCFESIVMIQTHIAAPTAMYRREVMDRVGGFDESLVAEDVDFFARVAHAGFSFGYDPEPLLFKREGVGNLGLQMRRWWRDIVTMLDKFRPSLDRDTFARYDRAVAGVLIRMASTSGDAALAREIAGAFAPRIGRGPAAFLLAHVSLQRARVSLRARAVAVVPRAARARLREWRAGWRHRQPQ